MATHSSTLAWKIPWMEEPRRLHGVAKSQTRLSDFTFTFFLNFRHENSRNSICIPMSLSAKRDVLRSNGEHLLHSRLHPTFYSAFLVTISLNKREKNFFLAFTQLSQILKSFLNMLHLRLWREIKGEIINRFFLPFRCNHSLLLGYKSFIFEIKVIMAIAVYKKQTAELTLSQRKHIQRMNLLRITLELLQLKGAYIIHIITCTKLCWIRIKDFPTSVFIGCEGMFLCTFKNITQIRLEK